MNKVIFTNVDYFGNAGDFWASPLHYYKFPFETEKVNFVEICRAVDGDYSLNHRLFKNRIIVIGGGGFITPPDNYLQKGLEYLIENNKVIIWGLGSNTTVRDPNRMVWNFINHKNIILCGIRDILHSVDKDYLPCVSAKHWIFDNDEIINTKGKGIGVIEHTEYPTTIEGHEYIKNNETIENIISFISKKESIVSTTFHGLYWSQLLGKKVVYFNEDNEVNSKFVNLKNRVFITGKNNFEKYLSKCSRTIDMIDECRYLNDLYYEKVVSNILKFR